jgi:hypothetical protein
MDVMVLRLIAVVSLVDDNNRGTFGFIVKAALPILFVATPSVAEVSESVEH